MTYVRPHHTDRLSPEERRRHWQENPDELTREMDAFHPPSDRLARPRPDNELDLSGVQTAEEALQEMFDSVPGWGSPAETAHAPSHLDGDNPGVEAPAEMTAALAPPPATAVALSCGQVASLSDELPAKASNVELRDIASAPLAGADAEWQEAEIGFPAFDHGALGSVLNPIAEMERLAGELSKHGDYRRIRSQYLRLSAQVNLEQRIAPAFRPPLSVPGGRNKVNVLIHKDLLVVDLHWLWLGQHQLLARDDAYRRLLASAPNFDFDAAWALAGKAHTREYRAAEALCLPVALQLETRTLHDEVIQGREKAISGGWQASKGAKRSCEARARQQIAQWASEDPRIISEQQTYCSLWLARELLGEQANDKAVARLLSVMTGKPGLDRTTIRDKLKRLDKRVERAAI